MGKVRQLVFDYSLLLIAGAIIAVIWANIDAASYRHFVDFALIRDFFVGAAHQTAEGVGRELTVHWLVNDLLMAFFFAIAAKEVWEAVILQNGALRGRKAATPLVATAGGMAGPVLIYLGLAAFVGSDTFTAVAHGWAIPTATDIAFAYLVGRIVFGAGHPAIRFLLLLAIADDAAGLIIIAVFYPTGDLALQWLLLSVAAVGATFVFFNWLPRKLDGDDQTQPWSSWIRQKFYFVPYAVGGALCWYGFMRAGIHPALGLVPIVAAVPHAERAYGIFSAEEAELPDLLNKFEHALKYPVEIILFFFGLLNAGVEVSSIGEPTWLVLAGLLIGKPLGITALGWLAAQPMRLGLPDGMRLGDLFVVGCVAAIGFTVSLFIASVAFEPGEMVGGVNVLESAKFGALLSFAAAIIAIVAGKLFRVEKQASDEAAPAAAE